MPISKSVGKAGKHPYISVSFIAEFRGNFIFCILCLLYDPAHTIDKKIHFNFDCNDSNSSKYFITTV